MELEKRNLQFQFSSAILNENIKHFAENFVFPPLFLCISGVYGEWKGGRGSIKSKHTCPFVAFPDNSITNKPREVGRIFFCSYVYSTPRDGFFKEALFSFTKGNCLFIFNFISVLTFLFHTYFVPICPNYRDVG